MIVMPVQKPYRSRQDYPTPRVFLDALEKHTGLMRWDLACTRENCKGVDGGFYFPEVDSLQQDWKKLQHNLWLNPPYSNIGDWARKCAAEAGHGNTIHFLVPASVGSNWFRDYILDKAYVRFLNPRLSFDGKAPYPKDLMLCIFGPKLGSMHSVINGTWIQEPIITQWNWKA